MRRRHLLVLPLAPLPFLALAACMGDDTNIPAPEGPADATVADASHSDAGADSATAKDGGTGVDSSTVDSATGTDGGIDAAADPVTGSFITLGCNRVAKGDWDASTDPSSANVGQLQQDFTDIGALTDAPKYFFFTGDLVLAEVPQLATLDDQLTAWTTLYQGSTLASKITLVAVAGNHELLKKATLEDGGSAEVENNAPDASADLVWTSWLTASGYDTTAGNGPTPAGANADQLLDDQSHLSYSFDDGPNHYVVLNTDTWTSASDGTGSAPIGWVPMAWLTADLQAAQANAATKSIFVFGHKPIVSPIGATDSADVINPTQTAALESALDTNSKVKGYFCAHYHAWDARQLPGQRGVYQVIAGNAGSTLETTWNPPVTYYGFTEVRTHASGAIGVVSYQRPVPSPYNATTGVLPATAQPELVISQ